MHDDFRFFAGCPEAVADEIDFRFDDRKVVLRTTLQNEARTKSGQVWNAGHVEEDVFRKHRRQSSEDFLRSPALTLEVHNVRLHEHGAPIAEYRHRLRGESQICILVDTQAEAFGG